MRGKQSLYKLNLQIHNDSIEHQYKVIDSRKQRINLILFNMYQIFYTNNL